MDNWRADLSQGRASMSAAVSDLRRRVNESQRAEAAAKASASGGDGTPARSSGKPGEGRPVGQIDVVRKLDLLQRLNDIGNGTETTSGDLSLQDRVFHSMTLEKLPDFKTLGPSFLRDKNKGKPGAPEAPAGGEPGGAGNDATAKPAPAGEPAAHSTGRKGSGAQTSQSQRSAVGSGSRRGHAGGARAGVKEIIIPLGTERLNPQEMHKLKDEFAVRYCESLNIAPTAANVADVLRRMPLRKCLIRQVIHPGLGRGERKNYVAIVPPCYKPALVRESKRRDAEQRRRDSLSGDDDSDVDNGVLPYEKLDDPRHHHSPSARAGGKHRSTLAAAAATATGHAPAGGSGGGVSALSFEDYKHRFVPPFNLSSRFEANPDASITRSHAGGTTRQGEAATASRGSVATPQQSTFGGRSTARPATERGNTSVTNSPAGIDLRQQARAVRDGLDGDDARARAHHQQHLQTYDAMIAKLQQGAPLTEDDVAVISRAISNERPLAVTAAHMQALDELLGRPGPQGATNASSSAAPLPDWGRHGWWTHGHAPLGSAHGQHSQHSGRWP
jgi:hypothetical protein